MAEAPGSFDPTTAGPRDDWFVLCVMTDASPHLKKWIKHLGFEVHEFTHERRRRKKKPQVIITFPGYLFVRLSLEDPTWPYILQLSGVLHFLSTDGEMPTPLRPGTFEKFRENHAKFFNEPLSKTAASAAMSRLLKGTSARLQSGPFATFMAKVVEDQVGPEVKVEIEVFGRLTPATIDRSLLPEKV